MDLHETSFYRRVFAALPWQQALFFRSEDLPEMIPVERIAAELGITLDQALDLQFDAQRSWLVAADAVMGEAP